MITKTILIPVMRDGVIRQEVVFKDTNEYMNVLVRTLTAVSQALGTKVREPYSDWENQFGATCLVEDAIHFAHSVETYLDYYGKPSAWKHYGFVLQNASGDPFDHGPDPLGGNVRTLHVSSVRELLKVMTDVQPVVAVNTDVSGVSISPGLILTNSTTPAREEYTVLLPFMETRAGRLFRKTIERLFSQHFELLEHIDPKVVDEEEESDA